MCREAHAVLYPMTRFVAELFNLHDIRYVGFCGTFLGAIRHGGIIPWDDDVDLVILEKDEYKLLQLRPSILAGGYRIVRSWCGYRIFHPLGHSKQDYFLCGRETFPF